MSDDRVREAARAFIDTMATRWSDVHKREIPAGFTTASSEAALALADALAESEDSDG